MVLPSPLGETLHDLSSTGRVRPWAERKAEARQLAVSMIRIGHEDGDESTHRAGSRVWSCGDDLVFRVEVEVETGEVKRKLDSAHFCRDRLCPLCAWRKSLVTFAGLMKTSAWVEENRPGLVPLFLTLTVRNCEGDQLGATLDRITKGFTALMHDRTVKSIVEGYFRSIEITYNADEDTWHPHIHAILMVDEASYFDKNKDKYLNQTDWADLWQRAAGLDYHPIVDIRRLTSAKGKADAMAEAAKYATKAGEWLSPDPDETDARVRILRKALKGRRLTTWGGVLREARKALKIQDAEDADADLVHTGDDEEENTVVVLATERWHWQCWKNAYECVEVAPAMPGVEISPPGCDPGGGAALRRAA